MDKTIAITGATGFAGGHAVSELLKRGYRVRALVRNPAASKLPDGVETVQGDLQARDALDRFAKGSDAVVHLAGAISGLTRHDYFRVNADGTAALTEAAVRAEVPRFVHISSLSARQPELSAYGASKRAGEDVIAKLAEHFNGLIIRPPAVYGPGDRATLPLIRELTRPIAVIPGQRGNRFSLIHVGDLARLIADSIENGITGLHEVSDGVAGGYGWPDLLAIAGRQRGAAVRPLFLPRAVPSMVAVVAEALSRITAKPGMVSRDKVAELYHPDWVSRPSALMLPDPVSFERGFAETLAWYRRAGWLPPAAAADRSGANANKETGS